MDRELEVEPGWKTEWLDRSYQPLDCYLGGLLWVLAIATLSLGVYSFIILRRIAPGTLIVNQAEKIAKVQKKVLKVTRTHFALAHVYLFHAFALTIFDAVICVEVLENDIHSNPDLYTKELWTETALYAASLFAGFMASFVLVPMLQMLLVTYILTRFRATHTNTHLTDYIPDARFASTHIAQIWCLASFALAGFWPPTDESNTFWRYMILQGCIGSAIAWLQASFAFNFRVKELERQDIVVGDQGVKEFLRLFGKTASVVHSYKILKGGEVEAVLPVYRDGAVEALAPVSEDKEVVVTVS